MKPILLILCLCAITASFFANRATTRARKENEIAQWNAINRCLESILEGQTNFNVAGTAILNHRKDLNEVAGAIKIIDTNSAVFVGLVNRAIVALDVRLDAVEALLASNAIVLRMEMTTNQEPVIAPRLRTIQPDL